MISMTGMGRVRGKVGASYFLIEIKSVNHRYCEVHTRLPPRLQSLEVSIVQLIKKKIHRGKIDVWIAEERHAEGEIALNRKALTAYHRFLNQVKKQLKISDPITLTHLQNGSSNWMIREKDAVEDWPSLKKFVVKALDDLISMRHQEGSLLGKQIESRLHMIQRLVDQVAQKKEDIIRESKEKLEKRIQKILGGAEVDSSKLASEVAFHADRSDVTEELERLSSHFVQMHKLLKSADPSGRAMDFLIQEMNREWNTISSKSQNVLLAQCVVEAKCEMEKIREQVQNIE